MAGFTREDDVESDIRGHHDIYYRQLLCNRRGSPLWNPSPDANLPEQYRRVGISIGDVGILYDEYFSFLFNIFLPAHHPINLARVPPDFEPFDVTAIQSEINKRHTFGPKEYFTSRSVRGSHISPKYVLNMYWSWNILMVLILVS